MQRERTLEGRKGATMGLRASVMATVEFGLMMRMLEPLAAEEPLEPVIVMMVSSEGNSI